MVEEDIWYARWKNENGNHIGYASEYPRYDDETIYFAVKVGWDVQ